MNKLSGLLAVLCLDTVLEGGLLGGLDGGLEGLFR